MNYPTLAKFQIGKNGITDGVIDSLSLALKNHKQVRVSVLKSFCRDRQHLDEIVEEIKKKVSHPVSAKVIGYTIILIKQKNSSIVKTKGSKQNLN